MGLFGGATIKGEEQQRCLAYYEAEVGVTAFQTREADLFNGVLTRCGKVVKKDPAAAREVRTAAHRLVEAAKEIVRRREQIEPVPETALFLHWAWHITSLTYAVWAQATLSAMETLSNGMTPHYKYVQHVAGEHKAAWLKAQKEEKKFLKQMHIAKPQISKIADQSIESAKADGWQPEVAATSDDEGATTEIAVYSI
ncbi:MAG: hypothetical protein P8Z79_09010 [Sedimentisphaerales bacterium]|jgi:hypothetical protein